MCKAWSAYLERLTNALEDHYWDGAWYQRGYFDDGTPLGSKTNDECQIDTIVHLGLSFLKWLLLSVKNKQ
ncbi:cellobiose phosphorylase [Bartonella doshiae]|uniref:Cellobiose phosphorylase n=2 Tax=Bartonella doshiae TaxID=33044 RepID=A0A380ZMH8_BARDO|nr:hypothetical protein MCS_00958 [Bartonella doshiae NCTC 12862 = ATCC 700133]MBB6158612.1 cellobiose phosphorylase [Bartonella doshiae]SUV46176.1 Cellobiose phosphorylase [Bartonella doshiae]